jgi:hypothetical protein
VNVAENGGGSVSEAANGLTELLECLRRGSAGSLEAVLLYGSHVHGAGPDRHSALDMVVVVSDYGRFYKGLRAASAIHRPAALMIGLAKVLPPNVIALAPRGDRGALAKCLIVDREDLERDLGPAPRDHFLLGRLVQRVRLVWEKDRETGRWVLGLLDRARASALRWVGPFLEEPFDAETFGRRLLELCYGAEFRPEAANRSEVVFERQRDHFREALQAGLDAALADGRIARAGKTGYRFVNSPDSDERRDWRRHFRRSKARVTMRWLKHVVTFDNWLPYVTRKVERRTGKKVELTRLERRLPVIFLWPRVVRVLLSRPESEEEDA